MSLNRQISQYDVNNSNKINTMNEGNKLFVIINNLFIYLLHGHEDLHMVSACDGQ